MRIARDEAQPARWRDYALQHLAELAIRRGRGEPVDDLLALADSCGPGLRGSALDNAARALAALAGRWPERVEALRGRLRSAMRVLAAPAAAEPALSEAVAVVAACERVAFADALPLLALAARDGRSDANLRVAAVHALATIGGASASPQLHELTADASPAVRAAARSAQGRLSAAAAAR